MNNPHKTHDTVITPESFWHAMNILITKPHLVNKRLWGCKILGRYNCRIVDDHELSPLPARLQDPDNVEDFLNSLISDSGNQMIQTEDVTDGDTEVILVELLPKSFADQHAFQMILLQKSAATFYDVTPKKSDHKLCVYFTYKFYLEDDAIKVGADIVKSSKYYQWLYTRVLPHVIKWSQETSTHSKFVNNSLALVPHGQYYIRYNNLKEKYGKELVKIWPECTDPSKFVYEDIAIATYLLLLWEEKHMENGNSSQVFVDMGCGNGLLVYILTMEGHNGYGIDVRKRKIWDMYPENIKLLEKTITPSNMHTFTDVNWVIGNHSDELTPWIPVIAARSSYKCKFFLLPCCAYNFNGTKYQRNNSSKTQYGEYLEYIQKLTEDCGFETHTDRLKIPSTKRICFVGKKRKYQEEEYTKYCESIDTLINSSTTDQTTQTNNFKAREATEKVRNCTQVDKTVVESIVSCIAQHLLEGCIQDSEWSPGKTMDIGEIVSLLLPDTLKLLKSQCGGLQTLLKNNHHIFKVQSGKIQLQYPKTVDEMNKIIKSNKMFKTNIKLKVNKCWFYNNHPQGCPLTDTECSFLH